MKRRFLAVIALLVAFVMCFALFACGQPDDTEPEGTGDPPSPPAPVVPEGDPIPSDKIVDAVEKLAKAYGYDTKLDVEISSDKSEEDGKYEVTLKKRDTMFGYTVKGGDTDEKGYIDIKTGYSYTPDTEEGATGYVYGQLIPAGVYTYIVDTVPDLIPGLDLDTDSLTKIIDDNFTYNAETKTATGNIDLKADANKLLKPLQTEYKKHGSLEDLIDDYLEIFVEDEDYQSLSGILGKLIDGYDSISSTKLGSVITNIETQLPDGTTVRDLLKKVDYEVTDAQYAALKERTVSQAVAGAYKSLKAEFGDKISDILQDVMDKKKPDLSAVTDLDVKELLPKLLDGLFFDPVTSEEEKAVKEDLKRMKSLIIAALNAIEVRDIVDNGVLGHELPADVKKIISDRVTFTELSADITFTMNDAYEITAFTVDGKVSHDYSGASTGLKFLADNGYVCKIDAKVTDYVSSGTFDITISANASPDSEMYAFVPAYVEGDVELYYEVGGLDITVTDIAVCGPDGETAIAVTAGDIAFDKAKSAFIIKNAAIKKIAGTEGFFDNGGIFYVTATVTPKNGTAYSFTIEGAMIEDDSIKSFVKLVKALIPEKGEGEEGEVEEG